MEKERVRGIPAFWKVGLSFQGGNENERVLNFLVEVICSCWNYRKKSDVTGSENASDMEQELLKYRIPGVFGQFSPATN